VIIVDAMEVRRLARGTRYGSAPHFRVVRVMVAVPAEISSLLLRAIERWHGGLPICLIKEAILRFFSCQHDVMLNDGPH
jgi:hypothetical protein